MREASGVGQIRPRTQEEAPVHRTFCPARLVRAGTLPSPDVAEDNFGVVWILGAGFSKALGGPLIEDLLAFRDLPVLQTLLSPDKYPGAAEEQFKARLFYKYGRDRRYWDHAEQFLDLVETADTETGSTSSHGRSLLQSMLTDVVRYPETQTIEEGAAREKRSVVRPGPAYNFRTVGDLAAACRRALAVDCSIFLRSAQLETERWSPYTQWARSLGPNHTVVTFNYDHVPELLASIEDSKLKVITPNAEVNRGIHHAREAKMAPVLKVHGSVTWVRDGEKIQPLKLDDPSMGDPLRDVVIGVPGPKKSSLIRDKVLGALWESMLDALRTARIVMFVGYRFPPTDADADKILADALRNNQNRRSGLDVSDGARAKDRQRRLGSAPRDPYVAGSYHQDQSDPPLRRGFPGPRGCVRGQPAGRAGRTCHFQDATAVLLLQLIETLVDDWYVQLETRKSRLAAVKALAQSKADEKAEAKKAAAKPAPVETSSRRLREATDCTGQTGPLGKAPLDRGEAPAAVDVAPLIRPERREARRAT